MLVMENWIKEVDINVSRALSSIEENDVRYAAFPDPDNFWRGSSWPVHREHVLKSPVQIGTLFLIGH